MWNLIYWLLGSIDSRPAFVVAGMKDAATLARAARDVQEETEWFRLTKSRFVCSNSGCAALALTAARS
jgi:hypothetical protein